MSKASLRRRTTAALSSALAVVLGLTLGIAAAAPATADTQPVDPTDPRTPVTAAADDLPTVQIDGVVWSQTTVGTTVYAGGSFQNARPAGAAPGTNLTPRHNLLAYDITTGKLITSFNHDFNGQVLGVTKSPDGSRLYVTGDFTQVDGQWRVRVAAFDTATGALVAGFRPTLASRGYAVAATNDTVYVGGNFTSVASQTGGTLVSSPFLAAFDATTGAIKPGFAGSADAPVLALTVPPAQQMVVVGGRFATLSGQAIRGLGAVDPATGAAVSFPTNQFIWASGADAAVLSLTSDSQGIYGSAYHFGAGGNLEGPFRADPVTGQLIWVADCHGDTYSTYRMGDALYVASHQHYCGNVPDGFPQTDPWTFHFGTAFSMQPTGVNTPDIYGYPDHPGQPAPSVLTWYPLLYTGTYTGQGQAGWSVTGAGGYLSYGGEFVAVNATKQQGLVRFATRDIAPNKLGPRLRDAAINPTLLSLSGGTMRVSWPQNWDRDNETLTYKVYRATQTTAPVFTKTVTQKEWQRTTMGFVDTGLTPGSSVRYRLTVSDPYNNTVQSEWVTGTVASGGGAGGAYSQAVLGDGASTYWRLGEAGGTTSAYDWAGFNDGVVGTGVTRGTSGAVGDSDAASTFDGSTNGLVATQTKIQGPDLFTVEAWIRTTSTAGGKIIGFGNANTGTSSSYDRHVYMEPDGRLTFGVWTGQAVTVSSAPGYNDGQWHHVVASLGPNGERLYVDGVRVGSRSDVSAGQAYQGYWRVGGDSSWSGANFFAGDIDDVAIYPTALSYQQVVSHWTAAGRTSALPPVPADAYGAAVQQLGPDLYWRLDETSGTAAADTGWSASPGTYRSGTTLGKPGAFGSGTAVQFDGASGLLSSNRSYDNPTQYSEELWFNTTTTAGGKLIGFGRSATGLSSSYDRHVYMESDGRLTFGTWTGQMNTTSSTASYNDGTWHHLVATQSADGMKLYVDGALVGTNPQTGAEGYTGYWRVGGDNNWGPGQYFAGTIDEVAVYPFALSAGQVAQHYSLGAGPVNQAPTAAVTASSNALAAHVDGTGSSDPDGTIADWAWDFGDSTPVAHGATADHTYAAPGTYTVTLTVTDNGGRTATATAVVTATAPVNQAPTAVIGSTATDLAVTFSSAGSADPDGTIASYAWTFGDGATSTQANPSHTYAVAGTYPVTLTVTDNGGATGTANGSVTVTAPAPVNQAPTASATLTPTGLVVAANGTASSDPDGTVVGWSWSFGDGTPAVTGSTASHTYAAAGSYTVTLTVTDDKGATGTTAVPVTVVAPNQLPTASFTTSVANLAVSVDGTASSDPDGTVASYAWTFGDGSTGTGASATHTYAAAGTYQVTLTVTDDRGGQASTQHSVTVAAANQPPVVDLTANAAGLVVSFTSSASDPDGTVASYAWTFGDGGTSTAVNPSHTYAAAGTYPVTLTVTDNQGATAQVSRSVTVTSPGTPTVVASDAFARTVASSWGAADVGGTWSLSGGNAGFQVTGGVGVQTAPAGITRTARLGFATTDADLTVSVAVDKAQTGGGTYVVISPRRVGSSEYQGRLRFLSTGVVNLAILRDGASLGTVDLPGTYTPGTALAVRLQATGTFPTALRLKVWRVGQAEPAAWQVSATDSTAALQAPGGIGISSYLSGSATNGPVAVSYDDLKVASAGAQPPVNQPPAAAFTASTNARTVSVDGSGSTDPEGAALGYAWDFGDGAGASGATAAHTYAADGTYTVTLTVTDAGGLTATTTRPVTVAAPVGGELGTDTFTRTVATGWGSANVGGPWSLTGTASAFKVDAGAGLQVVKAGATLTGYLPGVSAPGVDLAVRVSADQAATGGGTSLVVIGRRVGTSTYAGRVKLLAGGTVQVQALRDSTTLASANLAGTYTPGTQLQVRLRVAGTSPTTIQAKVWPVGQSEPTAWQVSTTDATAGLQAAGDIGLLSYVSGSATTVPVTVRWDELHVTAP